jgi:Uma2 family endonuclease
MKSAEYNPISEADYLALEARSPIRHEYVAGEIFAMTGACVRHDVIAPNLATALRTHFTCAAPLAAH